jgi:hypothetical protein
MEIVSSAELTITYDGEAVRSGLMDVRELAPALLATGTLLQKANQALNGERAQVSLKVKSEFRRGSFPIDFLVDQGIIEQAKNFLLHHPHIKDAKEILEIVFFYGAPAVSLFKLIKWLKKRALEKDQITFQNNGNVSIQIGGEKTEINQTVYNLYLDPDVRKSADLMTAPLRQEGMDKVEIRAGEEVEIVTNEEAPYFEYTFPEGEAALDTSSDALLEIVRLSFNPDHKWGFSDGNRTFNATMDDSDFWKRIDSREVSFSEGDQVLVNLRTKTFSTPTGLKSEHSIPKVIKFIRRPKTGKLPFE